MKRTKRTALQEKEKLKPVLRNVEKVEEKKVEAKKVPDIFRDESATQTFVNCFLMAFLLFDAYKFWNNSEFIASFMNGKPTINSTLGNFLLYYPMGYLLPIFFPIYIIARKWCSQQVTYNEQMYDASSPWDSAISFWSCVVTVPFACPAFVIGFLFQYIAEYTDYLRRTVGGIGEFFLLLANALGLRRLRAFFNRITGYPVKNDDDDVPLKKEEEVGGMQTVANIAFVLLAVGHYSHYWSLGGYYVGYISFQFGYLSIFAFPFYFIIRKWNEQRRLYLKEMYDNSVPYKTSLLFYGVIVSVILSCLPFFIGFVFNLFGEYVGYLNAIAGRISGFILFCLESVGLGRARYQAYASWMNRKVGYNTLEVLPEVPMHMQVHSSKSYRQALKAEADPPPPDLQPAEAEVANE